MTISDLAARLTLAAEDLAAMRAELAAESGFDVPGRGAAAQLAAHLTAAWQAQGDRLTHLSDSLSELAANVRLAARNYDSTDATASGAFSSDAGVRSQRDADAEAGATWTL